MSKTGISRDTFLILVVPVLLCVVAAVQLYLVDSRSLSRWKGGGFGMFTTVDSPSARFLRVYLISETGEVPVLIPRKLRKLSHKVRVMPSKERLMKLSEKLREGTWVHLTMVSATQHYQNQLRAAGKEFQDSADNIQYQIQDSTPYIDFEQLQLVRMLGEDEPLTTDKQLKVTGVRVEVWKYLFDREELVLRASKITHIASGENSSDV